MIPTNGSSFGRAGGRLRRYPGGTENASIFATVRGSMPNRRAASRRLIPSTYTARRTRPYSSTPFIPPPSAHLGRRPSTAGILLRPGRTTPPLYEGLSLRRSQQPFRLHATENIVEFGFPDLKGIVVRLERLAVVEVEAERLT